MLEICERPLVWTGEIMPSMFQAYKGRSPTYHIYFNTHSLEGTTRQRVGRVLGSWGGV